MRKHCVVAEPEVETVAHNMANHLHLHSLIIPVSMLAVVVWLPGSSTDTLGSHLANVGPIDAIVLVTTYIYYCIATQYSIY